jgi:ElaB/YqjD/DUF883 family membrane-anchored ribosome-binding protein
MNRNKSNIESANQTLEDGIDTMREKANAKLDSAHDAAEQLIDGISQTANDLRKNTKPIIENLVAQGQKVAKEALSAAHSAGENFKQKASRTIERGEEYVTQQPLRSVAIAAGVGAIAAAIFLALRSSRR